MSEPTDSGNDHQLDHSQEASDTDIDELLTSAALLCSGASDKQTTSLQPSSSTRCTPKRSANEKILCNSKSPNLVPSSVCRSLNFDSDDPSSERKRQSTNQNSSIFDRSQSYPSTPKSDLNRKSNVKKVDSPGTKQCTIESNVKQKDELSFKNSRPIDRRTKFISPILDQLDSFGINKCLPTLDMENDDHTDCEKQLESARLLLSNAKTELMNASSVFGRALTFSILNGRNIENPGQCSTPISLSQEERTFFEKLSQAELREVYEAEFYKRQYSEKKIDILQKQLLEVEQKLSVATVAFERYRMVVTNVEQCCDEMIVKEKRRKRASAILKQSNEQLKTALERVIAYGQMLGEKLENSNELVQRLEMDLEHRSGTVTALQLENKKIKEECSMQQLEIATLRKKLEQSEAKRKASFDREEQLTKEVLAMEKATQDNAELVNKLKNEVNNEKLIRKNQLEDKERHYKDRLTELTKDCDSRINNAKQEVEQRKINEMRKLKEEWDNVLCGLNEKYNRIMYERDEALRRLKEYEDTFDERQRVMCYELQQRLSAKYYELLSEFAPAGMVGFPNNGNPSTADAPITDYPPHNNGFVAGSSFGHYPNPAYNGFDANTYLSSSLPDEFLERLRNAYPSASNRHFSGETSKMDQQNKEHTTNFGLTQRANQSMDNNKKKNNQ